jgi:hypothetical protein
MPAMTLRASVVRSFPIARGKVGRTPAPTGDADANADTPDKSSKAESWHNLFSGAFVISRRSPELHPV